MNNIPSLSAPTFHALTHGLAAALHPAWAVLRATGKDARDYLQGQITQDIRRLSASQAIHAALLTPQGKPVSELYIAWRRDDELLLIVPASRRRETLTRLTRFRLGWAVEIEPADDLALCSVQGAACDEALDLLKMSRPADAWLAAAGDDERLVVVMPARPRGLWMIAQPQRMQVVLDHAHRIPEEELEAMRILRGLPRFGVEWDERVHPLNANLIEFDGVSFDKGCYVGQEVTSRMHWRGAIRKRLYRVELTETTPPDSIPCPIGAKTPVGELKSLARDPDGRLLGIAWLPIEIAEAGEHLVTPEGIPVHVIEPCRIS